MDRRNFFKIFSTASTAAITGACGKKLDRYIPLLVSDREIAPGEEQWHPALCGECAAGCGVIARVMEGERIVERNGEQFREKIAAVKKLEGNPLDPVSGGRLCARGQAALQSLYNPDRLRGPMRREGPRGEAVFAPSSWTEALEVVRERLALVHAKDPGSILFLTGPQAGTRAITIARFLEALGAPPAVTFELADSPVERQAAEQVHGWTGLPLYDLANARYALGIGADFLGGWTSPVYYSRQFGHFRQGRTGVRGTLVQAESRLSITAQSADLWVPLRPGTEMLFALAVGHLLLREKLARRPQDVPPPMLQAFDGVDLGKALEACGVDEKRALRVTRELGESEAPLIIPGASAVHTNSLAAVVVASYLNVLLGAVGRPGGVWPPSPDSTTSRPAYANLLPHLERARFVFLDNTDPLYTLPQAVGVEAKLKRLEYLVSFSPFVNDTAAYADMLLPDHHRLETTAAVVPVVAPGPAITLATPFAQPLYDTRSTEQVLAELAKKMEVTFEAAPPKSVLPQGQSWEEAVRQGGVWGEPVQPPSRDRRAALAAPQVEFAPAIFTGDESQFPLHFQPYLSTQFHDGSGAI
ncbi:MAG: molybdopterin-dependent oxidoreductase, partial [Acidobacteria bacterium]|nr:molybdopterin-dependent oxidoreductase [Acidobacteriota bacterium]